MSRACYNFRTPLLKHSALALIMALGFATAVAQSEEAITDSALAGLPDVKVLSKKVTYTPFSLEYALAIRQPVDHADTTKGFFYQQLYLMHRGFTLPMVMETEGYTGRSGGNELEKILHCNDLNVEFRYFNKSKPDSLLWDFLTFEQATQDLHHINQVFRNLYHSKWISTGISRGGETSLIYRYFFPDDVVATIPYVAPMPNDIEDRRIYKFLDTAGGLQTAQKIKQVQVFMLQHEKEVLERLPPAVKHMHFTSVGGLGAAYELAIMEYPFSFWQISDINPKDIPVNGNLNDYYNHFMAVFDGDFALFNYVMSDENGILPYLPHAFMTFETGYYKYNLAPFKNWLHYLKGPNPSAAFLLPNVHRKTYVPAFEQKINAWLAKDGNNILCIYGGRDTWSACKVSFDKGVNAKRFIIPGANHYAARIVNMPPAMQQDFAAALQGMTGLSVDLAALK